MQQFAWLVWQLVDSAFPAGAFAHSFGLEAAWQQGEVDAASLPAFVRDAIAQAGHGSLPFVMAAHDDPSSAAVFDQRWDAVLWDSGAHRARRRLPPLRSAIGRDASRGRRGTRRCGADVSVWGRPRDDFSRGPARDRRDE